MEASVPDQSVHPFQYSTCTSLRQIPQVTANTALCTRVAYASRGKKNYCPLKGTLRRRLSHGYFSFIAKYTSS